MVENDCEARVGSGQALGAPNPVWKKGETVDPLLLFSRNRTRSPSTFVNPLFSPKKPFISWRNTKNRLQKGSYFLDGHVGTELIQVESEEFVSTRWILTNKGDAKRPDNSITICWSRDQVDITRDGTHICRHTPVGVAGVRFCCSSKRAGGEGSVTGRMENSCAGRIRAHVSIQKSNGENCSCGHQPKTASRDTLESCSARCAEPETQSALGMSSSTMLQLIKDPTLDCYHHACATFARKPATGGDTVMIPE